MFLELALLPIYLPYALIIYALIRYRRVIKAMRSLDSLLSTLTDEDIVVDTPEQGVVQQRETLKNAIHHEKVHLLPGKKEKME